MKRILLSTLVASLLLVPAGDLPAQERDYFFLELTDEDLGRIDLHDGSIGDWLDVLGDPILTALDFTWSGRSHDPADMDFRIWLAWHDATNRVYVAVERSDDIYVNEFNRAKDIMVQHDSGLNFYVDGDGSKDRRMTSSGNYNTRGYLLRYARFFQWYMIISQVFDDGPLLQLVNYWDAPLGPDGDWYLQPPYAEGGGGHFGERPTISVNEFYVTPFDLFVWDDPTESQISDLSPGKQIGFRMSLVDVERGNQEGFFSVPPPTPTFKWADGFLVGRDGALPADTAVESITWGRIKASFNQGIP